MPGSVHSGSASRDDCGRMFPDKLRVSSFPYRFPHYAWTAAWSAHSDFVRSSVYTCSGVTCHLHFWQNDRGILNKSQHTKLSLEKKFSRRSCRNSNSQPFDHASGAHTNRLSRVPLSHYYGSIIHITRRLAHTIVQFTDLFKVVDKETCQWTR